MTSIFLSEDDYAYLEGQPTMPNSDDPTDEKQWAKKWED